MIRCNRSVGLSMLAPAAAIAGLCAAAHLANANVTYFDGVFNPSDWNTLNIFSPGNGPGSNVANSQILVGGNPNQFRLNVITLDALLPNTAIFNLNINNNAFYDPATQGAITYIDYSEDSIAFNDAGNVQGSGLLIIQNGVHYVQRNPVLVMPFAQFSNWGANPAPGLVASDLWEVDFAGMLDPAANPDSPASGGVMQLGYWRGASSGGGTFLSVREAGIDNWRVHIVPTPGTAAVGLIAGTLLAARRRRAMTIA